MVLRLQRMLEIINLKYSEASLVIFGDLNSKLRIGVDKMDE